MNLSMSGSFRRLALLAALAWPITSSAAPSILASGVGDPGDIIVDNSTVYWSDIFTGEIDAVSKNPGGVVTHYPTFMDPGGDLVQDNASIYFIEAGYDAGFNGHPIHKMSKVGGLVTTIGNHTAFYGQLAMGPAGGTLYYDSDYRDIVPNQGSLTRVIASLPTAGGSETVLIWDGLNVEAEVQAAHLNYWLGSIFNHPSTDSTYLYWSDLSRVWQMPLIGGTATAIVSGRTGIQIIATPTTGAAAGSIFWTEGSGASYVLMRRKVGGQIITVLTGITSSDRCFAVDNDKVIAEQGGALVQVSIDGGAVTELASVSDAFGPVGVAIDATYVYWSNLTGQILRLARPGVAFPTLSIADLAVTEGNSGTKLATFTVTLSAAAAVPVTYNIATANGTASSSSDYVAKTLFGETIAAGLTSKTFTVTLNGDTAVEANETFTVNLSSAANATIADSQAIGTITNDDGPTLSIADVSITEGNSGTKLATFTVKLSVAAVSAVTYSIATANSTATAGSDYVASTLTGETIAAGATSKTFTVTLNGDTTVEANEIFKVNLSGAVNATIADSQANGRVLNDDGPTLSIADVSISEGNSGTKVATFTVKLSVVAASPVTYTVATANSTATSGSDYVASTLAGQSIAVGATSKTFTVTINGDTTLEANETFQVNLSSAVNATIADSQAIGTILNDDGPTLSIADVAISEGNIGTKLATFTVTLSPAAITAVTYTIATANSTATAGSDFVATSLAGQSIAAGVTSKTFAVTLNGDTAVEANEVFKVNLSSAVGATIADSQANGTIINDDGPTLSIADVSVSEGNSGTKLATFTVTLSQTAVTAVTYTIATANSTATSGSDFVASSLTGQSIPAGTLTKTFAVTINGDATIEANEKFTVNLSAAVGATIADSQALGTIVNDD